MYFRKSLIFDEWHYKIWLDRTLTTGMSLVVSWGDLRRHRGVLAAKLKSMRTAMRTDPEAKIWET